MDSFEKARKEVKERKTNTEKEEQLTKWSKRENERKGRERDVATATRKIDTLNGKDSSDGKLEICKNNMKLQMA